MFNATLPNLSAAFSRRRAILGVVAVAAVPVTTVPALAVPAALHPADALLVELADAYYTLDAAVNASTLDPEGPVYEAMVDQYAVIEEEVTATPAATMRGVLAKARLCQLPAFRGCMVADLPLSIADDLVRIHAEGGVDV